MGIAKRARSGMKTRKSEKPSIDAGAVLGSCPWAKINSPWQWDKMLILAPARGRQPKSQLRWSNELGDLRGLRPPWLLAGCGALQAVYWNRVCVPSPPLWAGSQNNQKCRWHVALNNHPKLPLGGRRSWEAPPGTQGGMKGFLRLDRTMQSEHGMLRGGSGDELWTWGLVSPFDCLAPKKDFSSFSKTGIWWDKNEFGWQ